MPLENVMMANNPQSWFMTLGWFYDTFGVPHDIHIETTRKTPDF